MKFKKNVVISAAAPGDLYSRERKQASKQELSKGTNMNKLSGDDKCTEDINWKTDNCKQDYINQNITKMFNCTAPWLLSYAR